jgi:hypothetical protein
VIASPLLDPVTVTVKEQEFVFPAASVAVQVTVVVPAGNVEPVPAHSSVAVGVVYATTAEHSPAGASTLTLPGQVTVGAVESVTVTWKLHVAVCPTPSVAVQVTVVTPTGKVDPDAGVQVAAIEFPRPSVAVGWA